MGNRLGWLAGVLMLAACSRPTPIAAVLPSPLPITFTPTVTLWPSFSLTPAPSRTPTPSHTASAWPTVQTATPIILQSDTPTAPTTATETPAPSATPSPPPSATGIIPVSRPSESPTTTASPINATATLTLTPRPTHTPSATAPPLPAYLSGIGPRAREIFLLGRQHGQNPHALALVGDSNTDNPAFFAPFDRGNYTLGDYAYLQDSIAYFSGSFARDSVAAVGGFNTSKALDPAFNDPARCAVTESPMACEYRLQRPSVALILLGTGDQHTWEGFEARYRQIVEYTISLGIVPVLITKADDLESRDNTAPVGYINAIIVRLAGEYRVPLLDLRQAVEPLPNRGLLPDGFHYNYPVDGQSANFTNGYLDYGFNLRNLTGLLTLDALRRAVMYDAP